MRKAEQILKAWYASSAHPHYNREVYVSVPHRPFILGVTPWSVPHWTPPMMGQRCLTMRQGRVSFSGLCSQAWPICTAPPLAIVPRRKSWLCENADLFISLQPPAFPPSVLLSRCSNHWHTAGLRDCIKTSSSKPALSKQCPVGALVEQRSPWAFVIFSSCDPVFSFC